MQANSYTPFSAAHKWSHYWFLKSSLKSANPFANEHMKLWNKYKKKKICKWQKMKLKNYAYLCLYVRTV